MPLCLPDALLILGEEKLVSYLDCPSTGLAVCLRAPSTVLPADPELLNCCFEPPALGLTPSGPFMAAVDMLTAAQKPRWKGKRLSYPVENGWKWEEVSEGCMKLLHTRSSTSLRHLVRVPFVDRATWNTQHG